MTFKDCYRIALHTIKENKSRSILTVIISTFLSILIMGMMSLAISFSKNSNQIINAAYFNEGSIVSVEYQNNKINGVDEQKLFTKDYYDSFVSVVNQYSDVVQFVSYKTNISSTFSFIDPHYPNNLGIEIIEGRNIAKSEKGNEVIVSKAFYQEMLEVEPHQVGSEHTIDTFYTMASNNGRKELPIPVTFNYTVVGIFDYLESPGIVINGVKQYLGYGGIIADIGLVLTIQSDNVYISAATLYHCPEGKVRNPTKTVNRLNSLKTAINGVLPQALKVEYFNSGGSTERIDHYYDGATCNVYEKFSENKAIRSIVIVSAVLFSVILLLMSIGSLANSVIISIDCSKKFIGLLKALGMRGGSLKRVVVLESITLISVGVLLGYILLFALYVPLTSLINTIIGFTYSAYLKTTAFVSSIYLPVYVLGGALLVFLLLTYLFSRRSLHKIAKTDPMAVISEVS